MTKVTFSIGNNHRIKVFEANIEGNSVTKIPLKAFGYLLDEASEHVFDNIIEGKLKISWYDKSEIKDRRPPPKHTKEINTGSILGNLKEAQKFQEETGLLALEITLEEQS